MKFIYIGVKSTVGAFGIAKWNVYIE